MTVLSGQRRIWLTGASSGIGLALARRLLAQGHRVALSARRREPLERLASGYPDALVVPCDITDHGSVAEAARRIDTAFAGLDLLLHDAGTCEYLDARHFDLALIERVLEVNLHGALKVIDAGLPLLRRARDERAGRPLLAAVSSGATWTCISRAVSHI
ncbi:MAG: SDR family NAD(P)-dependent oxidoreductase [Pseudomonadota bacterium]|nr:SDR family NAD(P)-dependent oxidoreductase [Pseudomonadota bacterium]